MPRPSNPFRSARHHRMRDFDGDTKKGEATTVPYATVRPVRFLDSCHCILLSMESGFRWTTLSVNLENALLEFARVVKAREQVVAGTLHHLTVEAVEGGEKKLYEPKVWVKT
ncbi:hypothetical protein ZIOFF_032607 [Zingiber officinale]|uniref:Cysteine proteinase inhibitor n=1 Tax=Zingiber officinale TaxID=94328 RepID=A0A8J5GN00_ZINOF|nr:hypothetical protein ZIOFF_032607 [Zingiber officinale]